MRATPLAALLHDVALLCGATVQPHLRASTARLVVKCILGIGLILLLLVLPGGSGHADLSVGSAGSHDEPAPALSRPLPPLNPYL